MTAAYRFDLALLVCGKSNSYLLLRGRYERQNRKSDIAEGTYL